MSETPLPPFIMTSEPGSFARKTIQERKPTIITRILSHFSYPREIREGLQTFKTELAHEKIRLLEEKTSDKQPWLRDISPWVGKTWLEIPWFLAETYFYRRILEAVGYFQPGPWAGINPYARLKTREIRQAFPEFSDDFASYAGNTGPDNFNRHCLKALWGNRGDLSNLTEFEKGMTEQTDRVIRNDLSAAYDFLKAGSKKIAYFLDNVGKELFYDLALMDFLLNQGLAETITCYLKNQPFFVSDAMPEDLDATLNCLAASESGADRDLANRCVRRIHTGRIRIEAPPFFALGRMYRRMPEVLRFQVAEHDLTILKGDVNYRRLFGDRHWPFTTPVVEAAGYFPTSFLSLRTLKGEIALGLTDTVLRDMEETGESDWLINGKRGMITFMEKENNEH
jgi:hypothetical protein